MRDFNEMLMGVGKSLYTDDFVAKVLAFVDIKGTLCDGIVSGESKVFYEVVMTCMDISGLKAGSTPDPKIVSMLLDYIDRYNSGDKSWMNELKSRYNVSE